jgi:hypothetical protein
MTGFGGYIYPLVFDKTSTIRTLANDGGQVMEFDLRNNILFSGKTQADNGKFHFSFIVPKDINYSFGPGKISYYAAREKEDFGGSFSGFIVGGFTNVVVSDTSGPVIRLFLNDTLFRNGGISDENPILLALIEDNGGINTTGSGIGHDLTAFLDGDRNNSLVLNSYFETDLDNYKKGRVTYPLNDISKGDHTVELRAWDNFNNSSTATLKFVVRTDNGFIINDLINYPNPFISETSITAGHNRPDEEMNIKIYIYSMNGKLVRVLENDIQTTGYKIPPIIWDGNDSNGGRVGRGLYPYSIVITTGSGEISRASGRMIIL